MSTLDSMVVRLDFSKYLFGVSNAMSSELVTKYDSRGTRVS